jgi:hypothetical protein
VKASESCMLTEFVCTEISLKKCEIMCSLYKV